MFASYPNSTILFSQSAAPVHNAKFAAPNSKSMVHFKETVGNSGT
jgi:hypothetical protein